MDSEFILSAPLIGAFALSALIAYICGSVSFAVIYSKVFTGRDVRDYGSGNAGATNVFRAIGVLPGILTFICDLGKGALAILAGRGVYHMVVAEKGLVESPAALSITMCIAGIFAVIGHLYPLYFNFRGGKGVLTISGIILMLSPVRFLCVLCVFAVVFALTRTVSKGSCAAAVVYPAITFMQCLGQYRADAALYPRSYIVIQMVMAIILASMLLVKHRANIKRMLEGTEPKMVFKKKDSESSQEQKYC